MYAVRKRAATPKRNAKRQTWRTAKATADRPTAETLLKWQRELTTAIKTLFDECENAAEQTELLQAAKSTLAMMERSTSESRLLWMVKNGAVCLAYSRRERKEIAR